MATSPGRAKNHPPEDVFNNAYKINGNLSFGAATDAGAKLNHEISREGWKGVRAIIIIPSSPPEEDPEKRKPYGAYWGLIDLKGNITTWQPEPRDTLAEDWYIHDVIESPDSITDSPTQH